MSWGAQLSACLRSFATFHKSWIDRNTEFRPAGLRGAAFRSAEIPEQAAARRSCHTSTVSCVVYSLMRGESCGHVFLKCTASRIQGATLCPRRYRASPASPDFGLCFGGIVKSSARHIARCETRGKVVKSYDICCAQSRHGAACTRL